VFTREATGIEIGNEAFHGFGNIRQFQYAVAGFPISEDFLGRFPASDVQRSPDHLAVETAFDGKRTAAGAATSALLEVLAGLQMSSKKSEHGSS